MSRQYFKMMLQQASKKCINASDKHERSYTTTIWQRSQNASQTSLSSPVREMGKTLLRSVWICQCPHQNCHCWSHSPLSSGITSRPPLSDQSPSSMGGSGWSRSVQNRLLVLPRFYKTIYPPQYVCYPRVPLKLPLLPFPWTQNNKHAILLRMQSWSYQYQPPRSDAGY